MSEMNQEQEYADAMKVLTPKVDDATPKQLEEYKIVELAGVAASEDGVDTTFLHTTEVGCEHLVLKTEAENPAIGHLGAIDTTG